MAESNWKDTLYIWDGIVTAGVPEEEKSDFPIQWEGNWVPVTDAPDAHKAEVPKRSGARRDIDDDGNKFDVKGTATPSKGKDNGGEDSFYDSYFVAELTEGSGWEMKDENDDSKKNSHKDETHEVFVKNIRWSGNQKDERDSLVVAKGKNSFGSFCSVGWVRPGCRWTIARRYLDDADPRVGWSLLELHKAAVKESIKEEENDDDSQGMQKRLRIPPWQASVMHVDYQGGEDATENDGGKRQKTSDE